MRAKSWNRSFIRRNLSPSNLRMRQNRSHVMFTAHHSEFQCEIEGEALHRYKPGGYHPIRIGDTLNDRRYTIRHKLGWDGYGTSWLAFDKRSVVRGILTVDTRRKRADSSPKVTSVTRQSRSTSQSFPTLGRQRSIVTWQTVHLRPREEQPSSISFKISP